MLITIEDAHDYWVGQIWEYETVESLCFLSSVKSHGSVIPALWEAKVDRSRGQEIKTILANTVKLLLY